LLAHPLQQNSALGSCPFWQVAVRNLEPAASSSSSSSSSSWLMWLLLVGLLLVVFLIYLQFLYSVLV
jgi:hypothetical protein